MLTDAKEYINYINIYRDINSVSTKRVLPGNQTYYQISFPRHTSIFSGHKYGVYFNSIKYYISYKNKFTESKLIYIRIIYLKFSSVLYVKYEPTL